MFHNLIQMTVLATCWWKIPLKTH